MKVQPKMVPMLVRVLPEVHAQVLLAAINNGVSPYAMHQRVLLEWASAYSRAHPLKALDGPS